MRPWKVILVYSAIAVLFLVFWVVSMLTWVFDASRENLDVFTTASILLAIIILAAFV